MNPQIWAVCFGLLVLAVLILVAKRWLDIVPIWLCRTLAAAGLVIGVLFFAWTTRVFGHEVRGENPYRRQIVERYNMLHRATNRDDVRTHIVEIRTLLRNLSLDLPEEVSKLDSLANAPTQGYYDSILLDARVTDMAKRVSPDGLLRQQVTRRVYETKENLFFMFTGIALFMFLSGFTLDRRTMAATWSLHYWYDKAALQRAACFLIFFESITVSLFSSFYSRALRRRSSNLR